MKITKFFRFQRLHVWKDDNITWVVAFDPEDAKRALIESTGCDWDESYEPLDRIVPDREPIRIWCEPDAWEHFWNNRPLFSRVDFSDKYYKAIIAPAWAWCLKNGRGFLCSTEV